MGNASMLIEPGGTWDTLAAIANVIIAAAALSVAVISIYFTRSALRAQVHHNKLSVRPIPAVIPMDFENRIAVEILNNGTGPLIIKGLWVISDGEESSTDLIKYMPRSATVAWSDFNTYLSGTTILPGTRINLIELSDDESFRPNDFTGFRDECRRALAPLSVRLAYTDIYEDEFPDQTCRLDWFGRHGADS